MEKYSENQQATLDLKKIEFPAKSWFFSFKESTLVYRKQRFQTLLNFLLSSEPFSSDPLVIHFLLYNKQMVDLALNYFRAKLYALRQAEKNFKKEEEFKTLEQVQKIVKHLHSTLQEFSKK